MPSSGLSLVNLDLFWLKDTNAGDPDSLPPPDEIVEKIVENP